MPSQDRRSYDARRRATKPWRKLYQSKRWQAIRLHQLRAKPLCEWCEKRGRITPATVAHHSTPHRGDQALFFGVLLVSLCADCHDREAKGIESRGYSNEIGLDGWPTHQAHPANSGAIATISHLATTRRMPTGLLPSRIPLTIVCGPSGAGKSTYVRANASPTDLVIDLDIIKQKLSGYPLYQATKLWTGPALNERNRQLRLLGQPSNYPAAWYIVSAPTTQERQQWSEALKPSQVIVIDTPLDQCIARIRADPQRSTPLQTRMIKWARDWWKTYGQPPA